MVFKFPMVVVVDPADMTPELNDENLFDGKPFEMSEYAVFGCLNPVLFGLVLDIDVTLSIEFMLGCLRLLDGELECDKDE